jgi:hypothetical protein
MTLYQLRHETVYTYADRVSISHDVAHIVPRELPRQRIHRVLLAIEPTPVTLTRFTDGLRAARAPSEVSDRAGARGPRRAPWDSITGGLRATTCAHSKRRVARLALVVRSGRSRVRAVVPAGQPVLEGARPLRAPPRFATTNATGLATPLRRARPASGVCRVRA